MVVRVDGGWGEGGRGRGLRRAQCKAQLLNCSRP